jgi:hypothetical protein
VVLWREQAHAAMERMVQLERVTAQVQVAQGTAATAVNGRHDTVQERSFLGWLFSGRTTPAQTVSAMP